MSVTHNLNVFEIRQAQAQEQVQEQAQDRINHIAELRRNLFNNGFYELEDGEILE